MSIRSKGGCKYCGKEYTKAAMMKHLTTCADRKASWEKDASGEKQAGYFSLAIEGTYLKDYWLMIEIRDDATLKNLDQFLREIWLECCGHLSDFRINGVLYDVEPQKSMGWGLPKKGMNCKLKSVLETGMVFEHEYDFGSTTELTIRVFDHREGGMQKDKIKIMARNRPIEWICSECGEKAATVVCTECLDEDSGFFCDDCKKDHDCDEEMLMRICNSPRFGVCGYEGSTKYSDY